MLAYSVLVAIFWKPLFYFGKYAVSNFKDEQAKSNIKAWFGHLAELVRP